MNLLTADPAASGIESVERYWTRWAVEAAIFDTEQATRALIYARDDIGA